MKIQVFEVYKLNTGEFQMYCFTQEKAQEFCFDTYTGMRPVTLDLDGYKTFVNITTPSPFPRKVRVYRQLRNVRIEDGAIVASVKAYGQTYTVKMVGSLLQWFETEA